MNENVEKGLVGGIQKFSTEDGPGIRTTVFLKGCPLSCKWCHNPELINSEMQVISCPNNCISCGSCAKECQNNAISFPEGKFQLDWEKCGQCLKCTEVCYAKALNIAGKWMTAREVIEVVNQDKDFYDHTGGGLTISGGEVLSQAEFAGTLMQGCKKEGINVAIDTSGFGSYEKLYELAKNTNCTHVLFDMKMINDEQHMKYTGVSNKLILGNLKKLAADSEMNPKIIMRMPLVKGINDTDDIVKDTCRFYLENKIKTVTLIPYHQLGVPKSRNIGKEPFVFEPPEEKRLEKIKEYFESHEINVEILGKVK